MKVMSNVSIVSIDISKFVSHQMYVILGHSSNILDTPIHPSGPSIRAVTSWPLDPYYFHYLPSLSPFLLNKIFLVNLILHLGIILYFMPTPSRRPTLFEIPYSVRLLQSKLSYYSLPTLTNSPTLKTLSMSLPLLLLTPRLTIHIKIIKE